jgi:hypothetical protein
LSVLTCSVIRQNSEIESSEFWRIPLRESEILPSDEQIAIIVQPPPQPLRTWWPAMAWMIVSGLILARMAWSRAMLAGFQRGCEPVDDTALRTRVQSIAQRLGLRGAVRLVTSPALRSPAVFHWLRPVLALPTRFGEEFSVTQQDAVLAHELAHLARRDPAWQSAAMLVCALSWWQPLAWWARRRLRAASEAAADEASLLLPDGPSQLAESLISLAQRLTDPQLVAGISMHGNGLQSDLAHRVKRLLKLESGSQPAASPLRLVLASWSLPICFSLLGMICTAWAPSRHSLAKGDTTMNVVSSSWRSSVAATAFWAALSMGAVQADDDADVKKEAVKEKKIDAKKRNLIEEALEEKRQEIRRQIDALLEQGRKEEAAELKESAQDLFRKGKGGEGSKEVKKQAKKEQGDEPVKKPMKGEDSVKKPMKGDEPTKKPTKGKDVPKNVKGGGEGADGLEAKLKAIHQEAEELMKQGRKDEAEKLRRYAEDTVRKVKGGGGEGDGLEQKLRAMRQKAEQLAQEGHKEEAMQLMRQSEEMMRKMKGGGEGPQGAQEKLQAIRQQAEQLVKEGRKEEAEQLMRHAEEVASKLKGQGDPKEGGNREAIENKLRAVKDQVDQLRKEGKQEEAEQLARQAEEAFRKFSGKADPKSFGEVVNKLKGRGQPADSADDLRGQLQQMQRELKEVREQLRQLQAERK